MILGILEYMPPEQVEGKEADARSDIFALGVVIYEMATGRKAFAGDSKASVIAAILASQPPPLTTIQPLSPAELEAVVQRCLAKNSAERWQTTQDLLPELRRIAAQTADRPVRLAEQPTLPTPAAAAESRDGRYLTASWHWGKPDETLRLYDFNNRKWEELAAVHDHYREWSHDGRYLYFDSSAEKVPGVFRVRISDRKVERVCNLEEFLPAGFFCRRLVWTGARRLDPGGPRPHHAGDLRSRLGGTVR